MMSRMVVFALGWVGPGLLFAAEVGACEPVLPEALAVYPGKYPVAFSEGVFYLEVMSGSTVPVQMFLESSELPRVELAPEPRLFVYDVFRLPELRPGEVYRWTALQPEGGQVVKSEGKFTAAARMAGGPQARAVQIDVVPHYDRSFVVPSPRCGPGFDADALAWYRLRVEGLDRGAFVGITRVDAQAPMPEPFAETGFFGTGPIVEFVDENDWNEHCYQVDLIDGAGEMTRFAKVCAPPDETIPSPDSGAESGGEWTSGGGTTGGGTTGGAPPADDREGDTSTERNTATDPGDDTEPADDSRGDENGANALADAGCVCDAVGASAGFAQAFGGFAMVALASPRRRKRRSA